MELVSASQNSFLLYIVIMIFKKNDRHCMGKGWLLLRFTSNNTFAANMLWDVTAFSNPCVNEHVVAGVNGAVVQYQNHPMYRSGAVSGIKQLYFPIPSQHLFCAYPDTGWVTASCSFMYTPLFSV